MNSFIISLTLSLLTIGLINAQEIKESQIDFNSAPTSVQSGITKAMNRATQKSDEVWLSNPYFKSHFTEEAVAMSPSNNDLIWSWSLASINDVDFARNAPQLHDMPTSEHVDYNRGNITERYVFHGRSIEQQFIVTTMPAEGDLTIEGNILTEGSFKEKDDHWLWSNRQGSIKLGQLYVYDATGAEIANSLTTKGRKLEMIFSSVIWGQLAMHHLTQIILKSLIIDGVNRHITEFGDFIPV